MIDFVTGQARHGQLIMDTGAPCPGDNLDFSNSGAIGHTEKSTCAKYEKLWVDRCGYVYACIHMDTT